MTFLDTDRLNLVQSRQDARDPIARDGGETPASDELFYRADCLEEFTDETIARIALRGQRAGWWVPLWWAVQDRLFQARQWSGV